MRVSAAGAGCVCSVMWGVESVRHRKAVGWLRDLVGAMRSGGCGSNADWGGVAWPAAGQVRRRRVGKAVECASENLRGMRKMERGCAEALGVPSAGTLPVRRPPLPPQRAPRPCGCARIAWTPRLRPLSGSGSGQAAQGVAGGAAVRYSSPYHPGCRGACFSRQTDSSVDAQCGRGRPSWPGRRRRNEQPEGHPSGAGAPARMSWGDGVLRMKRPPQGSSGSTAAHVGAV